TSHTISEISADTRTALETIAAQIGSFVARAHAEKALRAQTHALQESEHYLKEAQAIARLGYWKLDPETTQVSGSDELFDIFGLTREEATLDAFVEIVHPDDKKYNLDHIERGIEYGEPWAIEHRLICRDGTLKHVHAKGEAIIDETEKVVLLIGTVQDITERKQATHALRESEERYRNLVETTPDPVVLLQDGFYQFVSPAFTKVFGYTQQDVDAGLSFFDLVQESDKATVRQRYNDRLAGKSMSKTFRIDLVAQDGALVPCETSATLTWYKGCPADLVTIRDITERVQGEKERERLLVQIQEQIQQVQQIMDTVPEGVLLLDASGRILQANPMAEKNLAVLADANVGDTLTHLSNRPLEELLTSPPQGLWHDVTANEQSFQIIARSIEVGPTSGGWVLVIRDVTQQREFERRIQQQERLASVGQLAAGIAHDFNNIMATIVLYAQMTKRTKDLPDRVRERMATINQQAQHATNLIRQILDFSRRSVLERYPFDLLPFLKEQVHLLDRTLPESIIIKLDYGPDEYTVNADPTRMQQMVTNLAVNARDAMPEGGAFHIELERVEIKSRREAPLPEMQTGEWVQMIISDTGTGISPDVLPHIYDPFFTTKEPGKGSGLGLAQVHGIVGQHEGHIIVDTWLDKGTTFTIYLPTLPTHPPEPSSLELESLVTGQEETILVIEDNVNARKAMVESLTLLNYRVMEATNGHEALEILEQHGGEIALVLSDVVMPKMGGIALFHTLRERGSQVPMLMLTGHPMEKELESLRAQGLSGWLLKPPNLEELARAVSQAMKQ
ncbi:MAG: PAS domain S-box protein, partial [Chloroflexi bacterium]|nr:PAS domain S-box protein [Chloroflexota bacterium]